MPKSVDPMCRALPVSEWPLIDQQAWMTAQMEGDVFDEEGRAAHWATRTRQTNEQHYGRWLGHLRWTGTLGEASAPADRVTREAVRTYNRHLASIVAPRTRLSMLVGLKVMLQAMSRSRSGAGCRTPATGSRSMPNPAATSGSEYVPRQRSLPPH